MIIGTKDTLPATFMQDLASLGKIILARLKTLFYPVRMRTRLQRFAYTSFPLSCNKIVQANLHRRRVASGKFDSSQT